MTESLTTLCEPNIRAVWCDQSPLVGAGVEVINGGHGIKNPLLQNNVLTQLVNAQQLGKHHIRKIGIRYFYPLFV